MLEYVSENPFNLPKGIVEQKKQTVIRFWLLLSGTLGEIELAFLRGSQSDVPQDG